MQGHCSATASIWYIPGLGYNVFLMEDPLPTVYVRSLPASQVPYLGLIQQTMWACPDSPMILLEAPHVGLRLQMRSRSVDDVAHAAAQILWRHTYEGACFVAHSYGTFCVSRICQLHRSLVHSVVSHSLSHPESIEWHTLSSYKPKISPEVYMCLHVQAPPFICQLNPIIS